MVSTLFVVDIYLRTASDFTPLTLFIVHVLREPPVVHRSLVLLSASFAVEFSHLSRIVALTCGSIGWYSTLDLVQIVRCQGQVEGL